MKYKTEWDLTLLYKNEHDPQIEKDIQKLEHACTAFEKKYKGKDFVSTAKKLLEALKDSALIDDNSMAKPWWYFALRFEKDSNNSVAAGMSTKMQERMTRATNKTTFFPLELGKIPAPKQKEFLTNPSLKAFHYVLKKVFDQAKYNLTEKEEQLIGLLSKTSYEMWIDGQRSALGQKSITFKGEEIPLSKASAIMSEQPKKERHQLHKDMIALQKSNSIFAEAEINAIINYKKITDELRGYKKSYSSTLLRNENDEKTIEDLVNVVTRYFKISHKFYELHAKLLGEKTITRADRMAIIGKVSKKYSFEESVEIVKRAFAKVDKKYSEIVQSFVDHGQLDVYPKKGKQGGAFCWGMGTLPTYVLLNHTDTLRSVETIAHEMGHAIHGELEKPLPSQYKGHSTSTAEVASTFFEQVAADELIKTLPENDQIILIHSRLVNDISCVFAQVAGFNYEVELHERIRKEGQLDREKIATLLSKHLGAFSGKAMVTTVEDGYHFVSWWHTRMFFYVYTYAYGQLVSRALYEKWKADPSYAKKIEQFLSAGRSMSPKDIFKSIGINTNEAFFEAGLKGIEADIKKLEKLAKKYKKI